MIPYGRRGVCGTLPVRAIKTEMSIARIRHRAERGPVDYRRFNLNLLTWLGLRRGGFTCVGWQV